MHITQCQKEGFLSQLDEQKGEGCEIAGHLIVNKVAGIYLPASAVTAAAAAAAAAAAHAYQATSTLPPENPFNKAAFTSTTSCLSTSRGTLHA